MTTSFQKLFIRDIDRLIKEVELYPDDQALWIKPEGINNSAGTLALHLVGNLNYFIGSVLGHTGYVRDRDAEFNDRDTPKSEILEQLMGTRSMLSKSLERVSDAQLNTHYPLEVFGEPMTTGEFLIHLQGHLNYHLGQVNYHRRLLT